MSWSKYDGAYGRQGGRIVPPVPTPVLAKCIDCGRILRTWESIRCDEHADNVARLFE